MFTALLERGVEIFAAIIGNPLVYLPLIGSWFVTAMYFILNAKEDRGYTYTMSSGIAHVFTAYVVSPFAHADIGWSFSDIRTIIVMALFVYGLFLIIIGIIHGVPKWMAEFFGDPGHALIPGIMAVLLVENQIPFDLFTFILVSIPPTITGGISMYRKHVSGK